MIDMTYAPDDKWVTGDAYEAYMGCWSRPIARVFVEWLHPKPSAHWLEVGCGTGALTSAICDLCRVVEMTWLTAAGTKCAETIVTVELTPGKNGTHLRGCSSPPPPDFRG